MNLLAELQRRNVIRMAGLYLVGAWLTVQVSSTVLPMFEAPAWLPRAIVIALVVGFLPAMIVAWVFEITPQGIKLERDIDRTQSITPDTGRRMDRTIVAVLALALGYFAFDKFVLAPRRDAALIATTTEVVKAGAASAGARAVKDKSIAVLPFADLSPAHDQEYFSDGMTEEILDALAKVQDLKVAGRTSSFYFKGKNEKLQAIGEALGVAHVLEGSVRKQGERVRVTAQLIQTKDGFHLWSDSYDGDLSNVFELQERIARAITDALKVALQGDQRARLAATPTSNAEAHEQLLRGRYLWNQRGYNNLRSAEVAFKAALALDPDYAEAWAGLAQTYCLLTIYSISDPASNTPVDTNPQALDAAERAMRLDPASSSALTARANVRFTYQFDWAGAEADFRAAIAANPRDVTAHQWYAEMLSTLRRWPEADAQYDLAETLDPLAAVVKFSRGASLTERGSYAAALPYLDAALKLAPGFSEPLSNKVSDLIDLRRFDEATAIVQGMSEPERGMLLSVIAALEDPAQKPAAVKQVMAHARDGILQRPTWLARLGEYELTLSELERLFAQKAPFREYLYSTVQFEPLHQKPRFQALLRQINLPLATTDKGKSG